MSFQPLAVLELFIKHITPLMFGRIMDILYNKHETDRVGRVFIHYRTKHGKCYYLCDLTAHSVIISDILQNCCTECGQDPSSQDERTGPEQCAFLGPSPQRIHKR